MKTNILEFSKNSNCFAMATRLEPGNGGVGGGGGKN
jgi:hypothetical protein